jgi:hypothetical protein
MTQDHPDLDRLGRVAPPAPGVLDAAREVLWAAVAAEMLTGEAPARTDSRQVPEHDQVVKRETDQPGR